MKISFRCCHSTGAEGEPEGKGCRRGSSSFFNLRADGEFCSREIAAVRLTKIKGKA